MVQDCCPINSFPSGPHDLFVGLELLQHKVAMSHRRGGEKLQAQVPAVISVPWIKLREQMRYHGIEMLGINLKHIKVKTVNECNYKIIVKFNIYIYIFYIWIRYIQNISWPCREREQDREIPWPQTPRPCTPLEPQRFQIQPCLISINRTIASGACGPTRTLGQLENGGIYMWRYRDGRPDVRIYGSVRKYIYWRYCRMFPK